MGKRKKKRKQHKAAPPTPDVFVTNVFMKGKWWNRISPRWVKGYRPSVTYREIDYGGT